MLIAVVSLWFNADARLWAAGFDFAGHAHGAGAYSAGAHALHNPAAGYAAGHDHGVAPAGDAQGKVALDHSICSAHCVPAVMAVGVQATPPRHFARLAISRFSGPPGRRADPPLIPPEYRS